MATMTSPCRRTLCSSPSSPRMACSSSSATELSSPAPRTRNGCAGQRLRTATATGNSIPRAPLAAAASRTRSSEGSSLRASSVSNFCQKDAHWLRPRTRGSKGPACSLSPRLGPCTRQRRSSSSPPRTPRPPASSRKRGTTSPAMEMPLRAPHGALSAGAGVASSMMLASRTTEPASSNRSCRKGVYRTPSAVTDFRPRAMRSPSCSCTSLPQASRSAPFTVVQVLPRFARKKEQGRPPRAEAAPSAWASCARIWKCSRETMLRSVSLATMVLKKSSCARRPTLNGLDNGRPASHLCTRLLCSRGRPFSPSTPSAKVHTSDQSRGGSAPTSACCTGAAGEPTAAAAACGAGRTGAARTWASGPAPAPCPRALGVGRLGVCATCGSAFRTSSSSSASRSFLSVFTTSTKRGRWSSSICVQRRARSATAHEMGCGQCASGSAKDIAMRTSPLMCAARNWYSRVPPGPSSTQAGGEAVSSSRSTMPKE
mmetsp:Transcript_108841/g.338114  ORF Transcript_108841/g.338114 Transcript_108841/m.338114 type:complete len:485 (+) Transcript_108841:542-1996(+)